VIFGTSTACLKVIIFGKSFQNRNFRCVCVCVFVCVCVINYKHWSNFLVAELQDVIFIVCLNRVYMALNI